MRRADRQMLGCGHRDPLGLGTGAEDLLQPTAQCEIGVREVDRRVVTAAFLKLGSINKVAEVLPELGLDAAEQHVTLVRGLVPLVLGPAVWCLSGLPEVPAVGEAAVVEARECTHPPRRDDGVRAGCI